ncbi:hypothetical protein GDO78_014572 [Eleutherodactylus coqui]|uniref:Secreted protein n=1 Tax=Eleutherodactylus coqui TaxID=57060 RepID=A0A8J6C3U3_ELECQ|nr:hypothetical protein GDO78_014572 [Eleutherodactylus coqui]
MFVYLHLLCVVPVSGISLCSPVHPTVLSLGVNGVHPSVFYVNYQMLLWLSCRLSELAWPPVLSKYVSSCICVLPVPSGPEFHPFRDSQTRAGLLL